MSKRSLGDSPLEDGNSIANKKSKPSEIDIQKLVKLKEEDVSLLSQSDLADALIRLRRAYVAEQEMNKALQKALTVAAAAVPPAVPEVWSLDKIQAKVRQASALAYKGIASQMKWTPSCRSGTARFSYTCALPNEDIFRALVKIPDEKKTPKMYKMPKPTFFSVFGEPEKSVRYDTLFITGEHVNARWNPDDKEFSLSGTFGKTEKV
ncbi:hypothetical protein QFC22_001298 [Naganishia vaughanmartiniae]|uniref:Uncharacterized protein n=1 Tax=Naganishia vaughanmartiniae TaxID=1424756 RepID=A0ACC2XHJ4_9TREE|nr:hypothetical protein QFC22_001298 [Naganishia vaughanmartiniae]